MFKPDGSNRELLIERKDSIQIEIDETEKRITEWKIKWEGCKYNLTLIKANFQLHDNMRPEDYSFDYEIIEQKDSFYIYKVLSTVWENDILSDTIWISK